MILGVDLFGPGRGAEQTGHRSVTFVVRLDGEGQITGPRIAFPLEGGLQILEGQGSAGHPCATRGIH